MKINVYNEYKFDIDVKAGDIIAYYNPEHNDYDYFMVVKLWALCPYRLLKLEDGTIIDKSFDCIKNLIEYAKQPINGYRLHEIISSDELELRRI